MIWAQILWGLFLAGLLGFSFHRAWRWEHGSDADLIFKEYGRETFVFVPPTVLFWILLGFSIDAMINVELMYPVFKKLMPADETEETAPDNEFEVDENADLSNLGYAPAPPKKEQEENENETQP